VKLLLINDEPQILEMIEKNLGEEFEIITANCAEDALDILLIYKPDAIVVDFTLPDMTGAEFSKRIRKNLKFDYVPIVILTDSESHTTVHASYQSGADALLEKPITIEEIRSTIKKLVEGQRFSKAILKRLYRNKYNDKKNTEDDPTDLDEEPGHDEEPADPTTPE